MAGGFDIAGAREAGYSDEEIAGHLAMKSGFDLTGARQAGYSFTDIVDHLSPTPAPKPEPASTAESRGTWGGDIKTGFVGTSQSMANTVAVRAAQEIASLKKQIETFKQGEPDLPPQMRHLAPQRQRQVPLLEKRLAEAEKRYDDALKESAQDAGTLKTLPVNEPLQRFTGGEVGEILKNPGAVARGLIGQSLTPMLPVVAGVAVGGPAGGAIAGGMLGAATGGGSEVQRILAQRGINVSDPEAVRKALETPDIRAEVDRAFGRGQAIEGATQAAAGALGGVSLSGQTAIGTAAKNVAIQAAGQGSISGAGEAAKQAAIEGELNLGKIAASAIGEALFAPVEAAAGAFHARARPEAAGAAVMQADSVDQAISVARSVVDAPSEAAALAEYGNRDEQQQAKLLRLFGGLNDGVIERAGDGSYFYRLEGAAEPLRVWDERVPREEGAAPTISPTMAAAQRDHYRRLGVDVVYFDDIKRVPFDGAVDPQAPNTIFLSNNPQRNAAQVGAHEFTHLLEDTTLPDGTNLGDLLHRQISEGITESGWEHARARFGETAPARSQFEEGPEGDAAHANAVASHLIRELGSDIGGEAPKFQTFLPRVVSEVEARYGAQVAKDILRKLIDGIQQAMRTMREFFSRPEEMAEYGQPETVSQNWVTNLDEIHATLARAYAERYGTQAEKENARLADMRRQAERDRGERPQLRLPAPALVTPPPPRPRPAITPENVFRPETYGLPGDTAPIPPSPRPADASAAPVQPPLEQAAATVAEKPQVAAEPVRPAEAPAPAPEPASAVTQIQREQEAVRAMRERARGTAAPAAEARPAGTANTAEKDLTAVTAVRPTERPPVADMPQPPAAGPRAIVNRLSRAEMEAESQPTRAPEPRAANADHDLANEVSRMLGEADSGGVTGQLKLAGSDIQRAADRAYGGTLAEGAYTRDRVYDAMELGVNRFIQGHPERFSPAVDVEQAKRTAADLAALKERLPTQTVRAGEKDAYQQFSTPPDYAYAANWIANIRPDDHVLEPSAGVGGLVVHAMNAKARETTVNELSEKRRGMIEALSPTRIAGEDAAQLHNILPTDVRPTVVVMNPPFSRSAERMGNRLVLDEGAKHIEQALARLEPGGRLIAIVGDGMKPFGTEAQGGGRQGTGAAFREWWNRIGQEYDVRANVGVDRDIYRKYGTSFPTRFLVIDKNPPSGRPMVTGQARDAADLIERLQEVRNDRGAIQPVGRESSGPAVAEEGGRGPRPDDELSRADGVVGPGEGRRSGPAAEGPEPTGATRLGERSEPVPNVGSARGGERQPVAAVEPEPVVRGAGGESGDAATRSGEPAGSGPSRGGGDLRPDGSGERAEPGVTPAPESVLKTEAAVTEPDNKGLTEAIYEAYRPQRVKIVGAKPHPGALVQSAAMATVMPPRTDYKPRLPGTLVKSGGLSEAQLEAITYAGHAHTDVMPNGKRRGFFIGDGTGVGKGREIAGILLDNMQSGRTKAVWVSEKRALINDAKRDWSGLGQPASQILDHGKMKPGEAIKADKGILFTSYDTLKSAEQTKTDGDKVRGKERVDQIVEWLGKDFDGVIAFDEAHNLGNSTDSKGGRGVKKAAQKALAGVALQDKLPNARVVYVSATGATEVTNLAYADRLGLWGEGTPFPNREAFVAKVAEGGMAAMELVARDMKALGHYIARNLSYDGVEYDRVEHKLTRDQRITYDKLAEGWQTVLQNFHAAMEITGVTGDGKTLDGRRRSAILSAFWGAHQRFFNQIITSMQMPAVIRGVEADLKAGRQAVLQLVNTMEAAQERALEKARAEKGGEIEDLDMTPRDQLMQLVEKAYPVQQMEEYIDEKGSLRSRPAVDSKGNPILNRQAVAARDRLLDELGSLKVPDGPLEMLLNHFGPDKVAEVTGRGQRVIRAPDDSGQMRTVVEKRGAQSNVADTESFQAGKKPILIFSQAGGTGRSYHAAIGSGSEKARRSHYLVQGGWKADAAVQGFGRTHRTNQASAPIFHLVTTDLQGQKRFISSIARRLGQLGALTKGERRTGDQGLFGMRDNLESTEARTGLVQFFKDVAKGQVEGVTMADLERGMGLKLRDPETGGLTTDLPPMTQFLNRVLSLKIDDQNRVFDAFSQRMDDAIDRAAAAGTLDTGVETYKADRLSKVSEQTVYTDPRSGAETKHVHLAAENRNHPVGFDDTLAGRNKTNGQKPDLFIQNNRSGKVFAVTRAGDRTDADGRVTSQVRLTSPIDYQFVERSAIGRDNWKKLTAEEARTLWDEQVAATPEFRKSDLHLITGAVLPIWDRIGGNPKIYRLQTADGERMLGRVIPSTMVDATLQRLGAEGIKVTETPAEIAERVLGGATANLANEWKIKPSRVAGETRLEIVGPDYRHGEELSRHGVFSERINYQTRFFIPTTPEAAAAAIEAITKTRPVTSLADRDGPKFSPRQVDTPEFKRWTFGDNPNREYTAEQQQAKANVRGSERLSLQERIAEFRQDLGKKVVREMLDPYVGLRDRDPAGYMAARLANSAIGAVDMFNVWGTLKFNGPAYATDKQTGGPVGLIRRLGPEAHDFMDWVAANRAERLKAEDRENLFTTADIAALKSLNRGQLDFDYDLGNGKTTRSREKAYLDALRRLDDANQNAVSLAVDSGLLKRGVADALWSNPFYVPFYRQAEESNTRAFVGAGGFTGQTAGKRLTGGTEKLNTDLWGNAFGNWAHMIDASIRNKAANQILEQAEKDGIVTRLTLKEFNHEIGRAEKAESVWTMVDGEKVHWRVEDPFTLKAITALDYVQSSLPGMGIGRAAKKLLQVGVAASPIFQIRSLIRDTSNAIAVSPISKNIFRNLYDGARQQDIGNGLQNVARAVAGHELEMADISRETADAIAGGATVRYAAGADQSFRKADTYLDSDAKLAKFWQYFRRVGHASTEAMAFGENVNRLALYQQLGDQPHALRAYEGRDLSDFSLVGASPLIRHLVELVPYMNPWMQGLYKVGRVAAGSDKSVTLAVGGKVAAQLTTRLAFVIAGMTAINLALDALYSDDPDYRARNEYDRNSNFWFKVGGTEFRIPMGFEVAALSRMAAVWIESLYDTDMSAARAWKNTLSILGTQMAFNPIPQVVKPLYDLDRNETRMGTPIETQGMERLRPEFRSGPETTLVSKGVSGAANKVVRGAFGQNARAFSPVQLDYLVQAYSGWLGTSALQIADTVVRGLSNEPEKPAKGWLDKLSGGIASNDPTSERTGGLYVNMLYQQGDAIKEAYATYRDLLKRQRIAEAREYLEENRDLIVKYPLFEGAIRTEGAINQRVQAVSDDPRMTGEQKKIELMRLNALRNKAAERVFAPAR